MRLGRGHAVVLLLIAVWNVLSYANFARNLYETAVSGADRPAGYYAAHVVLIVVNLLVAVYLARLGLRAWRSEADAPAHQSRAAPPRGGAGASGTIGT